MPDSRWIKFLYIKKIRNKNNHNFLKPQAIIEGDPKIAVKNDERQLAYLSLAFKIYGEGLALFSCFFFIYIFMGIMMLTGGSNNSVNHSNHASGWFFIISGTAFFLLSWVSAVGNFYAGRFLKQKRHRTFCFVMSCINLISIPLGLILGIFSLNLLSRATVKEIFAQNDLKL